MNQHREALPKSSAVSAPAKRSSDVCLSLETSAQTRVIFLRARRHAYVRHRRELAASPQRHGEVDIQSSAISASSMKKRVFMLSFVPWG